MLRCIYSMDYIGFWLLPLPYVYRYRFSCVYCISFDGHFSPHCDLPWLLVLLVYRSQGCNKLELTSHKLLSRRGPLHTATQGTNTSYVRARTSRPIGQVSDGRRSSLARGGATLSPVMGSDYHTQDGLRSLSVCLTGSASSRQWSPSARTRCPCSRHSNSRCPNIAVSLQP